MYHPPGRSITKCYSKVRTLDRGAKPCHTMTMNNEPPLPTVPVLTTEQLLAELAEIDATRTARLEARAQEYFDSWEDGDYDADLD